MNWTEKIVEFASLFDAVACVGNAPLAETMIADGIEPTVLANDPCKLPGWRRWDLERPVYIAPRFGVVVADVRGNRRPTGL